jgi:hypothetical protein
MKPISLRVHQHIHIGIEVPALQYIELLEAVV